MQRESMEFDVVIVGAGPAGLSTACRLMQQANDAGQELMVCVVEKGAEVGGHILSGAVVEPRALDELFPEWKAQGAPLKTEVTEDQIYLLKSGEKATKIPNGFVPKTMHNHGNYIASVGNLCRWLAEQAEQLGVEIFPGFPASHIIYGDDGRVAGIGTGDMGLDENGEQKDSYMPGMDLLAKYTIFTEGCRGHLGKELIAKFELDKDADAQHYGIGIKELWDVPADQHQPGLVLHGAGWPLSDAGASGGFFLYHAEDNQVVVGLITDLNYDNPHLSPFDEFQRMKHHPLISKYLQGGKRVSYGARAITKGGFNALPKMTMPGALLLGCDAGTLNFAKIKGTHTAMKSGMIAAETIFAALTGGDEGGNDLTAYGENFKNSWVYEELYSSRNFGPALHKYGTLIGGALNFIDQNIFSLPFTIRDNHADYAQMKPASECAAISYPKPDGVLSFDKPSSVFISNTNHEENQPCHLKLKDSSIPLNHNLPKFNEPAQRYCPAGVYEVLENDAGEKLFQINSQNCVHCKTCDIKDPAQNITWVAPEGGGGPNYPNM
ncbi:electron transfer flavoprotein-ubiquinone oxidoreductase [Amphritea pacifica]|uniref:Electron transfer flavoprotein-ubiquinone oxidoreductase n=1 Tax=Amphritea pacifica TaxID=2811233 RepID=A0ABS2WBB8_9GAMM|nr:electron transfer flavoprotein-ubiquinone oxidoreductase [Amphritea pacifica]MBN0989013.1 electron transfer flavoprotein-ubiquinone oxidoreductase [Amphritea pacifica]MBN1008929.1 electron transfer flavoprotein-ubiquinone oxidoreductase [Amphritea pacifica]